MQQEDFGDRPEKLIAAFRQLDSKKTGKIPVKLAQRLLTSFDMKLNAEELTEFSTEADDGAGNIEYEKFVRTVIFGNVN